MEQLALPLRALYQMGTATLGNPYIILALIIFIALYAGITFEHQHGFAKEPLALLGGVGLYLLARLAMGDSIEHALVEVESEIFEIIMFLFPAMILVELLLQMGFFTLLQSFLQKQGYRDRKQFRILSFLTFFLSAVLDNLTTTLVMINMVNQSFKDRNRHIAGAGTVANANAGGAWSPIGDVTTIMLWLAGKFTAVQVVLIGILPAVFHGLVVTFLLGRKMTESEAEPVTIEAPRFSRGQKIVMAVALACFSLPLIFSQVGAPPYMGLLLGLGVTWLLQQHLAKNDDATATAEDHHVANLIRLVDHRTLFFFTGILLMVGALGLIQALLVTSNLLLGDSPDAFRTYAFIFLLGPLSAIVDNVPLTALAIDVINFQDHWQGVFLALCVGTGGSALIIGSVAGVVAMGRVEGLNSKVYAGLMVLPVLTAYIIQTIVFMIQYRLFS
jgi:Na+/H+ antiporter NhaD/arsenite permease-like protein